MKNQDSTNLPRRRWISYAAMAAGLLAALFLMDTGLAAAPEDEKVDRGKISMGKGLFRSWCRVCHGETGKGDGPMAENLRVAPSDLTLLSQRDGGHFYFGRVSAKIDGRKDVRGHGSKDMPVWGEAFRLLDETTDDKAVRQQINALAHYLRSIQAASESDP